MQVPLGAVDCFIEGVAIHKTVSVDGFDATCMFTNPEVLMHAILLELQQKPSLCISLAVALHLYMQPMCTHGLPA